MRWSEEVLLLQEEMRRVGEFLDWEAEAWHKRECLRSRLPEEEEGIMAYAVRQAQLRRDLAANFRDRWKGVPKLLASRHRHAAVLDHTEN
jgi:hypothetical protein